MKLDTSICLPGLAVIFLGLWKEKYGKEKPSSFYQWT